jgi:hypothetical protein
LLSALAMVSLLPAQTSGPFSYTDNGTSMTITGYPRLASGPVDIPASIAGKPVTRIHYNAFRDCLSITSVALPASVTQIGRQAFARCESLAEVLLPHGVIQIDDEAFLDCVVLESIAIPASVTEIGTDGFRRCASLREIVVDPLNPNFSSADGVLYNKSGTTLFKYPDAKAGGFVIPAVVQTVSSDAFADCRNLEEIIIPQGVVSIGSFAFSGCEGLTGISIPASVTSLGAFAFRDCIGISAITVDPANPNYSSLNGVLCNKNHSTLIQYPQARPGPYAVPATVTSVTFSAFQNCRRLTEVTLPAGLATLANSTFAYCHELVRVTLPAGLTGIGSSAFFGCASLAGITIPAAVATIEATAFMDCENLGEIVVDPLNPHFRSVDGVLFNKAVNRLVKYPQPKAGDYQVPATVATIDSFAFRKCPNLTSLAIPAATTSMVRIDLDGCRSLAAITVAPTNPNFSSVDGVLCNKNATSLIRCPEAKAGTFAVPTGVTSLLSGAFQECASLTGVTFSTGITTLRQRAFRGCAALSRVTLPAGLETIEASAFQGCLDLSEIAVPAAVTSIGDDAFSGCERLTSVAFPVGLVQVGARAFVDAARLSSAIFHGGAPEIAGNESAARSFGANSEDFAVYYFDGMPGFSSPTWMGYPALNMGAVSPWPPWLVAYGFAFDLDPLTDANGDGVPLLMAYALALDPRRQLGPSMPRPQITGQQMRMVFFAGREELVYAVEASADLKHWSSAGVSLSAPDADGHRTASLPINSQQRFMRLVVLR